MDNQISNKLKIIGDKHDVLRAKEFLKTKTKTEYREFIDFNNIIKIPKELLNTVHPMRLTQKLSDKYKEKFGTDNEYDWCMENWGVETNPTDFFESENNFYFKTNLNHSLKVIQKLSLKFPKLIFELSYSDEKFSNTFGDNIGRYTISNGNTSTLFTLSNDSLEALKFAIDVTRSEYYYMCEYLEAIQRKNLSAFDKKICQIAYNYDYCKIYYPIVILNYLKKIAIKDNNTDFLNRVNKTIKHISKKLV